MKNGTGEGTEMRQIPAHEFKKKTYKDELQKQRAQFRVIHRASLYKWGNYNESLVCSSQG